MTRLLYDTDLTDHQWQILEPLIPAAKPGGRPRSLEMREVLNQSKLLVVEKLSANFPNSF